MFLVLLLFQLLLGNLVTAFLSRPPTSTRPFDLSSKTSEVLDFFDELESIDKQMALRYLKVIIYGHFAALHDELSF